MGDNTAKINQLQRHFQGNNIDRDVLESVLLICDGDVNAAIQFLTAQEGQQAYNPNQNPNGVPADYPEKHKSNQAPRPAVKPDHHEGDEQFNHVQTMKKLFVAESSLAEHVDFATKSGPIYVATALTLLRQGIELAKGGRPKFLATCWSKQWYKIVDKILNEYKTQFSLVEVLRGLELLDARRRVKALQKRVARLEKQGTAKRNKVNTLKAQENDLSREILLEKGVSGALAKRIKQWVRTIPAQDLEYFALHMPKEPWKLLSDIVHLSPEDFTVPWFLSFVYGAEPPRDSSLPVAQYLSSDNLVDVLSGRFKADNVEFKALQIPYSYLRVHIKPLPHEAKPLIAKYTPLETLMWYHEELNHPQVNQIIKQRLESKEEKLNLTYGKLMERLLYFKKIDAPFYELLIPLAEEKLNKISLELEPPVVVLGDASYSMDVAIRTSTIIASVLTVLTSAELKFFNVRLVDPPLNPKTIPEVVRVATEMKADGLTASACALWPYYQQRKKIKFFIVVTDEVENEKFNGTDYFPSMYLKYYQEVYPAKLVFVSFLDNPGRKGRMVTALENMGFDILQFKLDGARPDLTKLDTLLGLLSSEGQFFVQQVLELSKAFEHGADDLLQALHAPPKRLVAKNNNNNNAEDDEKKINLRDEADLDEELCIICQEKDHLRTTALLDCGHLGFCESCAQMLKTCPICRGPVVKTVKIFKT